MNNGELLPRLSQDCTFDSLFYLCITSPVLKIGILASVAANGG